MLSQKQSFANDYAEAVLFQMCGVSHRMGVVLQVPQRKRKTRRKKLLALAAEESRNGLNAQEVFAQYDVDGSGIQTQYLSALLDELQCPMSADQIYELAQHLDASSSGCIGEGDFMSWWESA